ncbi:hypothetical protein [Mesorhizobium sp. dw_380]|uniref:hypothetical protein n=1 Tax=Mesorhizobium sp. dw_380 TaxID=2812001 RepID=UPI001BDF4778|nr:hypothetical protein [Mesorhizobium sp. dw_380]
MDVAYKPIEHVYFPEMGIASVVVIRAQIALVRISGSAFFTGDLISVGLFSQLLRAQLD